LALGFLASGANLGSLFPLRTRHQAGFDEAAISLLAHDEVVQDPEVDGAGCLGQGAGEILIFRGRLGVAAGVVGASYLFRLP